MMVAARAHRRRSRTARSRELPDFLEPGDLVVVNTSGPCRPRVDGLDAARRARRRAPVDPARRRPLGGRAAAPRRRRHDAGRRRVAPRDVALGEGASLDARSSPYLDSAGCGSPRLALPQPVLDVARRARPPDPLRLRRPAVAARRRTRTCTPPSRAAPRCRAPAGRSRPR